MLRSPRAHAPLFNASTSTSHSFITSSDSIHSSPPPAKIPTAYELRHGRPKPHLLTAIQHTDYSARKLIYIGATVDPKPARQHRALIGPHITTNAWQGLIYNFDVSGNEAGRDIMSECETEMKPSMQYRQAETRFDTPKHEGRDDCCSDCEGQESIK
jgi:hypothetical protein